MTNSAAAALGPLDYAVIAAYLAAITAFGSWFARYQHTTQDYFLSGHSVPWWAVCCTVVATETSTLTFIGIPATAYAGNWAFLQLALGYVIGRIVVSVLFIPAYFRGDLVTSYELLQRRFGRRVTLLSAGLFLVTRSLADGIRLFATALVIGVVTGVSPTWTTLVVGALMIVYTVRGGAAAVIWTDVVQMFVYVAGAAAVAWQLLAQIPGGWDEVVRTGMAAGKFAIWDLSTDPSAVYTLWTGLFGGVALTLATHGTDQFLVQRLLAATSARAAATGLVLSGAIVFAQFTLFLTIGVMLYTFYQHAPLVTPLGRTDEILPTFVVNQLPPGLAGFIVAAIVAAALSPSLSAMAATTVNDFYKPRLRTVPDEATLIRLSRRDHRLLGRGAADHRARRADDGSLGARRRSRRPVVHLGRGPRRVHHRPADAGRRRVGRAGRHGRRPGDDDRGVGVHAAGLDVVRAGRRADDLRHRLGAVESADGRGMTGAARSELRRLLADAVATRVTPGVVVEAGSSAGPVAVEMAGHLTYRRAARPIDAETIYDLASLTKVIATGTLAMRHAGGGHAAARSSGR